MNPDSTQLVGRVQRRRQDARARVLEAAGRLFAERGLEETPMARVAEAADVSVGTLYNLFANKEALFRELVYGKALLVHERMLAALASAPSSAVEAVDAYLRALQAVYETEAAYIRLYFRVHDHARVSLRAALSEDARRFYDETTDALAKVLERGNAAGELCLTTGAPYRAAVAIQALAGEMFFLHLNDPAANDEGTVFEEVRRAVHTGILGLNSSEARPIRPQITTKGIP